MSLRTLQQLQQERDSWRRMLAFMQEENIHLKSRLSDVLSGADDQGMLQEAENFQSRFLREDELIILLRGDVMEFDELLVRELFEDGAILKSVQRKCRNIRKLVNAAETQFSQLKHEFSNYVFENFSTK